MSISVNGKKIAGIGKPGKSAYQAAVDGGYTKSESEFNATLANMDPTPPDASDVVFAPGETGMESSNVQDAIEELFTSVSDGKSAIAAAVTDKGIETAATDSFAEIADKIGDIETGIQLPTLTVPASNSDLRVGKQMIDQNGKIVYGSLSETKYNGYAAPVTTGPYGSGYVAIPFEVPDSDRIVKANDPWYISAPLGYFGNATAADVAAGKTFTSTAGLNVVGTGGSGGQYGIIAGSGTNLLQIDTPRQVGVYSYPKLILLALYNSLFTDGQYEVSLVCAYTDHLLDTTNTGTNYRIMWFSTQGLGQQLLEVGELHNNWQLMINANVSTGGSTITFILGQLGSQNQLTFAPWNYQYLWWVYD